MLLTFGIAPAITVLAHVEIAEMRASKFEIRVRKGAETLRPITL